MLIKRRRNRTQDQKYQSCPFFCRTRRFAFGKECCGLVWEQQWYKMWPHCLTCYSGILIIYLILIYFFYFPRNSQHIQYLQPFTPQSAVPTTAVFAPLETSLMQQEAFDLESLCVRTTEEQVASLEYVKWWRCEARAALWERNFRVGFLFPFSLKHMLLMGFCALHLCLDVVWYSVVRCSAFMPKVACTGLVWGHTLIG